MLPSQSATAATTFGYLSAVESPEHGYFGGYLIVSPLGRPVEFHCTAPVRPSRAQEILYGATLHPYLLGEQIAGTLLGKAQTKPQIVLTDQPSVLCLRPKLDVPLVLLKRPASDASNPPAAKTLVSGHGVELAAGFSTDADAAIALLNQLAETVDLPEPFDRIHEAIREAQRIDERGGEANAQAA